MNIKTYQHKGYTVEIHTDDDAESPREWDNLAKLFCFHGRYNLGDENPYISPSLPEGTVPGSRSCRARGTVPRLTGRALSLSKGRGRRFGTVPDP